MSRVHICSTIDIPTYERLAAFARDQGIVHPTSGEVNTSDAVRKVLDLALAREAEENTTGTDNETSSY